ncbi:MAG: PhoU domain protein [Candidatus Methanofastidiosum methylothiophilum]|uniref:PhoU domain protein n=1 Tax=Candidatus Methanofastidiosum methylothiophilum TaxID=1705564 RepID=A0A150IKT4_9EURY|nr:MAG: PhoU domain protein [Candidatus Methanofastidiosum methylthiophilus]
MESRKVQVTGKSTYIVTLPKKWAKKAKLEGGETVSMSYLDDGSLVIAPPDWKHADRNLKISFEDNVKRLKREIVGIYILDEYTSIEIIGKNLDKEMKKEIKHLCKGLIGFEVVEDIDDRMIINDFLEKEELTISHALKRMSSIVYLMMDELVIAMQEQNDNLFIEVISRDDDVDRMYLLISKQYISRLHLHPPSKKDKLSLIESFYYRMAAEDVESIADHVTKIAAICKELSLSDEQRSLICQLILDSQKYFMDIIDIFRHVEKEKAHSLLDSEMSSSSDLLELRDNAEPEIKIVIDSIKRIREYAKKITEYTIDLSQL